MRNIWQTISECHFQLCAYVALDTAATWLEIHPSVSQVLCRVLIGNLFFSIHTEHTLQGGSSPIQIGQQVVSVECYGVHQMLVAKCHGYPARLYVR